MPTEWYREIVSKPPVPRGKKSFAYAIPDEFIDGPARKRVISIQAAFVRPQWTLVFVDHNVMIQFHLMLSQSFLPSHLDPGSKVRIHFLVFLFRFATCLITTRSGPTYGVVLTAPCTIKSPQQP